MPCGQVDLFVSIPPREAPQGGGGGGDSHSAPDEAQCCCHAGFHYGGFADKVAVLASVTSRHKTLNQCWFDVGPPSTTLAQR